MPRVTKLITEFQEIILGHWDRSLRSSSLAEFEKWGHKRKFITMVSFKRFRLGFTTWMCWMFSFEWFKRTTFLHFAFFFFSTNNQLANRYEWMLIISLTFVMKYRVKGVLVKDRKTMERFPKFSEVPGSNLPPYRYLDLFSVAPSSTPRPRCVNSQLISLPPVGILNSLCHIWNFCFFMYSVPN